MMLRLLPIFVLLLSPPLLAAKPKPPIYGERSLDTGTVQLNRAWSEPVLQMLQNATVIEVSDPEQQQVVIHNLDKELQGEKAGQLLGTVIALFGKGEIAWRDPDTRSALTIRTDPESVQVANKLLPLITARLQKTTDEPDKEIRLIDQLQGRWLLDQIDMKNTTAKLETHFINIDGDQYIHSKSFLADEEKHRGTITIDTSFDPPRIQVTPSHEKGSIQEGLLWLHAKPGSLADAFGIVMTAGGDEYPESIEQADGVVRVSYRRDDTDPERLLQEAKQLQDLAVAHLLSDQVRMYPIARRFFDWSLQIEKEADYRQQAEDQMAKSVELKKAERYAEAKAAQAQSESFTAMAEQVRAERIERTRIQEQEDRTREKADQLALRYQMLLAEGRLAEGADVAKELNDLLRSADPDNFRIVDLERRVAAARLAGDHALASALQLQAEQLRSTLSERYQHKSVSAFEPTSEAGSESKPIVLQHAKAAEITDVLQTLGMLGENLNVAIPRDNLMILMGNPVSFAPAVEIIEALDQASKAAGPQASADKSTDLPLASPPAHPPLNDWWIREQKRLQQLLMEAKTTFGNDHPRVLQLTAELERIAAIVAFSNSESNLELSELEALIERKGFRHPDVQDKLAMVAARHRLYGQPKPPQSVNDWDGVISRQRERYEQAEREAARFASEYSKVTGSTPKDEGKRRQLESEVNSRVSAAFGLRMVLQLMQLEKAHQDLTMAGRRLAHRHALADKIVQRRVEELLAGEDLSWLPNETKADTTSSDSPALRQPNAQPERQISRAERDAYEQELAAETRQIFQSVKDQLESDLAKAKQELAAASGVADVDETLPNRIADLTTELRKLQATRDSLGNEKDPLSALPEAINPGPGQQPLGLRIENNELKKHRALLDQQIKKIKTSLEAEEAILKKSTEETEQLEAIGRDIQRKEHLLQELFKKLQDLDISNNLDVAEPDLKVAVNFETRVKNHSQITGDDLTAVCSVVVSPDGKHLYAAARDANKLLVFGRQPDSDGPLTKLIQTIDSDNDLDGVLGLRITPDGKYAVTTSYRSRTVTLFARNPETGELTRKHVVRDNEGDVIGLHWPFDCEVSPDSVFVYVTNSTTLRTASILPSVGEGHVTAFHIVNDKLKFLEVHTGRNNCFDGAAHMAIHPTGKWLYVANYRSAAIVVIARDLQSGQMQLQQIVRDNDLLALDGAFSVNCSPDGKHLYASSGRFNGETGLTVFRINTEDSLDSVSSDLGSLSPLQVHRGGTGNLVAFSGGNRVLFSPDGHFVYVMASLSGTLVSFRRDQETGRLSSPEIIRVTPDDGSLGPASIGISPEGRYLYAGAQEHETILILEHDR